MNKRLFSVVVALTVCLTGCSRHNSAESTTEFVPIDASNYSIGVIESVESQPVVFDSSLDVPIIREGVVYGTLHINHVEKLGIWDLNNYQANQNGVHFSYAINCFIDMETYLQENDTINLRIVPMLYSSSNELIGSLGYVGWSGYNDSVEMYANSSNGYCEVVLQPTEPDVNNFSRLEFGLTDVKGDVVFDSVNISLDCLMNAVDGAQLKTIDETTIINSINGASYSITFHDVYLEQHMTKKDAILKNGTYNFYDFQYDIAYINAPTIDKEVLTFDSFNNNSLVAGPVIEIYSDQDSSKLFDEYGGAQRLVWADKSDKEYYVTDLPSFIQVGETATVSTNRLIPDSTILQPTYIRIVLKFPEEVRARNTEEILDFNGRYVVYQIPLSSRVLEAKPK